MVDASALAWPCLVINVPVCPDGCYHRTATPSTASPKQGSEHSVWYFTKPLSSEYVPGIVPGMAVALSSALSGGVSALWYHELPACNSTFKPFAPLGCYNMTGPDVLEMQSEANLYNMTQNKCAAICKGSPDGEPLSPLAASAHR